ncbi:MAG TPA: RusA family crossover junction endodeoxyribonuclease [Pirellulales bacterium]|nr:RusA family crossover junction endodeoxyribonuclease [Pirellulales bacterium]
MGVYLEFVVLGPPISNQQSKIPGKKKLEAWRARVAGEAQIQWPRPLLMGELKAIIINFFAGDRPSVDVDNMSKPILDAMQAVVYHDDRQIRQAELIHSRIGAPYSVVGTSQVILNALHAGQQFVYVRVENSIVPYPLPT